MSPIDSFFYIIILIISIIMHEVAHGYAALYYGDPTAKNRGRLSLNPLVHIDIIGSIIVPGLLLLSGAGFVFGWAKPVPIDERNFIDRKRGLLVVSLAGIAVNMLCAIVFSAIIRLSFIFGFGSASFVSICGTIVLVNIVLGFFNLMPIPPLDGSKIFFSLIPERYEMQWRPIFERYALPIVIIFAFFVWPYIAPAIFWLFKLFTVISF